MERLEALGGLRGKPFQLSSNAIGPILDKAIRSGRQVIVDAPALLDNPFNRQLMRHRDGAIVMIEAGKTRNDPLRSAIQAMTDLGTPLLGTVLSR